METFYFDVTAVVVILRSFTRTWWKLVLADEYIILREGKKVFYLKVIESLSNVRLLSQLQVSRDRWSLRFAFTTFYVIRSSQVSWAKGSTISRLDNFFGKICKAIEGPFSVLSILRTPHELIYFADHPWLQYQDTCYLMLTSIVNKVDESQSHL